MPYDQSRGPTAATARQQPEQQQQQQQQHGASVDDAAVDTIHASPHHRGSRRPAAFTRARHGRGSGARVARVERRPGRRRRCDSEPGRAQRACAAADSCARPPAAAAAARRHTSLHARMDRQGARMRDAATRGDVDAVTRMLSDGVLATWRTTTATLPCTSARRTPPALRRHARPPWPISTP